MLQADAHARAEYIQRESADIQADVAIVLTWVDLQELRFLCVETIKGLVKSTVQLPYTVKMMARETLLALRVSPECLAYTDPMLIVQIKYPDAYDEDLTPIIARTVILPFILPALM